MERKEYFNTFTADLNPEDFHSQLAALIALAKNGRDLSGFHYDAISLLSKWLRMSIDAVEAARRSQPKSNSKEPPTISEEKDFNQLIEFLINVVKFSFNVSDDEKTGELIDQVITIAMNARFVMEIKACLRVLDAICTYGVIPSAKLKDYITILCHVHLMIGEVRDVVWRIFENLCKSHNGHSTVSILLHELQGVRKDRPSQDVSRQVRATLIVLEKIVMENGRDGYPLVPFSLLTDGLSTATALDDLKVDGEVMRLISRLFGDENEPLKSQLLEEDWTAIFETAVRCANRVRGNNDGRSMKSSSQTSDDASTANYKENPVENTLNGLIARIEHILRAEPGDFMQRESCILFFSQIPFYLPDSCVQLVTKHFAGFRFCFPSDVNWEKNINLLLETFFMDRSRPADVRRQALTAVTDVYEVVEVMDEYEVSGSKQHLITGILKGLKEEKDVAVMHDMMAFAVAVCDVNEPGEFDTVIEHLHACVSTLKVVSDPSRQTTRPAPSTLQNYSGEFRVNQADSTPATVITRAIIQIFMRAMDRSTVKALRSFNEILWIANSNECDTPSRLSAMKMLFRLRADWANRIFLTPFTESDALAASLYRTAPSLAKKQALDDAQQQNRTSRADDQRNLRVGFDNQGGPRAVSGMIRTLETKHQLWMTPDPEALPEQPSNKASTLLVSTMSSSGAVEAVAQHNRDEVSSRTALNIKVWLTTATTLLQQGCDWEVYTYILAHLPSQLTNHTLFKSAVPEIKVLRTVLCEQITKGSFQEPPIYTGLRKADVAICLFQILTMVMSYHRHFGRSEEDDIVRCFIQGMTSYERAGKFCIHALSICCHEFPASMKLVLSSLLRKMSQIVTQSAVAVHILEFLAGLSRLPELYSNFREEDYMTVFGICFRYLQSVRDKKQPASRSSTISGNSNTALPERATSASQSIIDDLPQYVFSLAYHVSTYWFLSLRLSDRATHVNWITKNLVWTDDQGKQQLDEQAVVTLDFMRRTAYADVDESRADEDFTPENHGEILKERWIVGLSIITVEQATRTGWAQITKRQPSATSHYMVRQKFDAPHAHQVVGPADGVRDPTRLNTNFFLASNLPVQLLSPVPESARPIKLPKDDMITRAIKSMDRISTVDGHKVGVIYIGAGQTHEKKILPNVSGSTDYMVFLSGLGTLTKLQGATFNTQGLDRQFNTDGEFSICWRDRVTELVFHVTTMMPTNLEHDPYCTAKKRHIGNDFVNIIFNNSGNPFKFDTFPSEFNYVNIVITPESRASFMATRDRINIDPDSSYYKVQVLFKEGFPEISPASETKILCLRALPHFIRLLALNASVFCVVWANRQGENVSSWRSRLREINRLREKYKNAPSTTTSPPGTGQQQQGLNPRDAGNVRNSFNTLRRVSVANFMTGNEHEKSALSQSPVSGEAQEEEKTGESLVDMLDFSRWA